MLKFQLDTLEGVDENLQSLYTEKDGKFTLNVTGTPQDQSGDVENLKAALDKERGVSKGYKSEIDKNNLKQAEGAGDIESIKKQMADMHKAELAERDAKLNTTNAQLRTLTIDNVITSAVAKEGGITDLLKPYIAGRTQLNETGGVEVLNDSGDVMVDKEGNNVSINSFVTSLKENSSFAGAFKGTTHSGGGTTPSEGVGASAEKSSFDKIKSGLSKLK